MNKLYWSIRRELWENRALYAAPAAVVVMFLFGFLISLITLRHRMHAALLLALPKQRRAVELPFDALAALVLMTAFLVAIFYCIDALHGERRDRSILFWKSLPVSDFITVLAKAAIPIVVLPLLILIIIVITHTFMLVLSTIVLLGSPRALTMFWTELKFVQAFFCLAFALVAIALWYAPIYGWLLMISGWARRAALLWATLPLLAISMFERMVFHTAYFANYLKYRVVGWFEQAFNHPPKGTLEIDPLNAVTPGRFLATPGLWLGLIVAALFIAAAVRLRRDREPI